MSTLLPAALVFAVVIWLVTKRRAAALAAFFILFGLVTRVAALIYVDLGGPIYAVELGQEVGGKSSMPLFAASVLAFLLPLAWAFRPGALRLWVRAPFSPSPRRGLANLVVIAYGIFLLALHADMVWRGPIPLFSGMDRLEYNKDFAGALHSLVFDFGFLFASALGMGFVYPRLRGAEFDFRFLVLLAVFFAYFALTGNRFSAFFSFGSFYAIPMAAILASRSIGALPAPPKSRPRWVRALCSPAALLLAIAGSATVLMALVLYNLTAVRDYEDPAEQLAQRTMVQPVQLWWTTWSTLGEGANTSGNWVDTFVNPIDPTRNTGIQLLMIKNLGDERAQELLDLGQQYAGGYPEVIFELVTPGAALLACLMFGLISALLLRMAVRAVFLGRFMTAVMSIYVFFGFSLLYIGGMLNFLMVATFWIKIGTLAATYFADLQLAKRHRKKNADISSAPPNLPSPAVSPAGA